MTEKRIKGRGDETRGDERKAMGEKEEKPKFNTKQG